MPFSLHSHSGQFCKHAKGELEEVVQEAIRRKFLVYGLSEHCPRYRVQDLYPEESHLQPSDLAKTFSEFVLEARRLQLKYKSKITLLVGLESENITDSSTSEIIDLVSKHDLDYVVGSVHHVHETPIDFDRETFEVALSKYSPNYPLSDYSVSDNASINDPISSYPKSPEESLFISYFDSQYQILQHLRPMIVGHFDVIRIYRPKYKLTDLIWQRIERNVEFVIGYGGLFEINSAGFKYFDDAYPLRDIFELIIRKGGKFTISDDSHGPSM
ncbi:11121_t:CDS:2, partial [Acaulospora morrowiae]